MFKAHLIFKKEFCGKLRLGAGWGVVAWDAEEEEDEDSTGRGTTELEPRQTHTSVGRLLTI